MNILPDKKFQQLAKCYREAYGLQIMTFETNGRIQKPVRHAQVLDIHVLNRARAYILNEALRWGDTHVAFLAPALICWIVPIVDGSTVRGGLTAEPILADKTPKDLAHARVHLVKHGASTDTASSFIRKCANFPDIDMNAASKALFQQCYNVCGFSPLLLQKHKEDELQQRRIAEAIQENKSLDQPYHQRHEEHMLLSLIRAGDHNAARGVLNSMLAQLFLSDPNLSLMKARIIELTGHLVRTAIEDTPTLEPLLEQQQRWMNQMVEASSFEALCRIIRVALDSFMTEISRRGYIRPNRHVETAMDYIEKHYRERLTLDQIAAAAGISRFRLVHLVKEVTGRSLFEHLKQIRVEHAQQILRDTDKSCSEICYMLGFADQNTFTRQFKDITGTTPASFRGQ